MKINDLTKLSKSIKAIVQVHDTLLNDLETNSKLFNESRGRKKYSTHPKKIITLKNNGIKNAEIARLLNVSPQYVGQIIKRSKEDSVFELGD